MKLLYDTGVGEPHVLADSLEDDENDLVCVDCHEMLFIRNGDESTDPILCHECEKKRLESEVARLRAENAELRAGWWRQRDGALLLAEWMWRRHDALERMLVLGERLSRTIDRFGLTLARIRQVPGIDWTEADKVHGQVVHDAAIVRLEAARVRREAFR